ncbi:MAG: YidC/Oxa1 family membrane protein insertase [Clostridia bacterium]|nr:YidC/Oxa1 family membrane protein insertase [Clostridia bacterium]
MQSIYDALAVPFGYILHFFYEFSGNYLFSLILLVFLVKLVLLPSSIKQQKNSAKQLRLQPKLNRIRQKYSNGGQMTRELQMRMQEETQELYRKEGYNPTTGGCLPLLIQFPVMIGLYGVVYTPLSKVLQISQSLITEAATVLGISTTDANATRQIEISILNKLSETNMPECLAGYSEEILNLKSQFMLFGKIDLTLTPSFKDFSILWLIPLASLVIGLITSFIMYARQKKTNPEMASNPSMGCMTFMSPLMTVIFTFMFPAGVGVYWILSSLFSLIQTVVLNYAYSPEKVIADSMIDETVERRSRENYVKKLKEFSDKNSDNR